MKIYIGKDNRTRIMVRNANGKTSVISYPRYIMEQHLGRRLLKNEHVHHIDKNPLNNEISNLQIKMASNHARDHQQKYFDKMMICPKCGKEFLWTNRQQSEFYRNRKRIKTKVPYCSQYCVRHKIS